MHTRILRLALILWIFPVTTILAQDMNRSFDAGEYLDLLAVSEKTHAKENTNGTRAGKMQKYELAYRSPEMGLLNRWELWMREDGTALISIRGTVMQSASWMENFYAAMVPATGSIQLNDNTTFKYKLATDERAAVHVGWTIGLAYLGPDILKRIDSLIKKNNTNRFIIFGHSQGGALAYLTTSWLHYKRESGEIPANVSFTTYCSAPPKPGNMQYVYDFDFITRGGKAFAIVNAADWVPETPGTVQTFGDLNPGNPLSDAEILLGKQKWPVSWILKKVYRKMRNAPEKTLKVYEKNFGHRIYGQLKKSLPGFKEPEYVKGSNYMRAGIPVLLLPDAGYHEKFPPEQGKYFTHHLFEPYRYLINKYYPQGNVK